MKTLNLPCCDCDCGVKIITTHGWMFGRRCMISHLLMKLTYFRTTMPQRFLRIVEALVR